jgi:hypothetical protein
MPEILIPHDQGQKRECPFHNRIEECTIIIRERDLLFWFQCGEARVIKTQAKLNPLSHFHLEGSVLRDNILKIRSENPEASLEDIQLLTATQSVDYIRNVISKSE